MNKLLKHLLTIVLAFNTYAVFAATTPENSDDGSAIGTAASPQVKTQGDRTDKGSVDVNQGGTENDASNLGNADSPQHKKQMERTNKTKSDSKNHHQKNKVQRSNEANHGTTDGNKVQPSEPEQATPVAK
ncbi:MAG: hypothetical protein PSV17_10575 [Methylotenera sp.]|uniref:hypothetical protein n=1 Tax=Methylotenera sp. TaxID=2051956 RepID=UPI00248A74F8|nr:hypothetical protein [Methylotenera sp.]MDI1309859.1 hypothetical protein [Methylotenera sp.]